MKEKIKGKNKSSPNDCSFFIPGFTTVMDPQNWTTFTDSQHTDLQTHIDSPSSRPTVMSSFCKSQAKELDMAITNKPFATHICQTHFERAV